MSYSTTTFLTSDVVAHSLLEFAAVIGRANGSQTVVVPALTEGGEPFEFEMVIGPSSQLSATPVESEFAEPESTDAVAAMDRATAASQAVVMSDDSADDNPLSFTPEELH